MSVFHQLSSPSFWSFGILLSSAGTLAFLNNEDSDFVLLSVFFFGVHELTISNYLLFCQAVLWSQESITQGSQLRRGKTHQANFFLLTDFELNHRLSGFSLVRVNLIWGAVNDYLASGSAGPVSPPPETHQSGEGPPWSLPKL